MKSLRDKITRDVLEKLYLRQRLTQTQIAERYGVSQPAIHKLVREYDLPVEKGGRS
jgi:DNA-binding Lrp family transcriptional regulator